MAECHLPQVRAIEITGYPYPWSEGIFKDCINSDYLCKVVIDSSGNIVAYAIVSVAVEECHVLNICVAEAMRGQGISRWLLRYMLDTAKTCDAKEAFLEVRPSNTVAIHLYSSFGFAEVGRRNNYYANGENREDALIMAMNLTV
ncbi:MAG: ribosomal-protein-alanine N-acetyltransferase [Gammaproteobacteria bacterium]|nr:MAG: ribosomal-protein-alanine N-acetyltransferase [Gammaproteobacteria bacterium]